MHVLTRTPARPGAHDIIVMVATEDPLPLPAHGPTRQALATAVGGT